MDYRAPSWTKGERLFAPLNGAIGLTIFGCVSTRNVVRNAVASASKYRCIDVAVTRPAAFWIARTYQGSISSTSPWLVKLFACCVPGPGRPDSEPYGEV